jgi:hypothetical protein
MALLSFPFWFLTARFNRELDPGMMGPPPVENPGTPAALGLALLFATGTFLLSVYTLRKDLWKR